MKFLVALALLATVYASPDECAWGESYWCSSLTAARTCGKFQHCMDEVWPKANLDKDDTDVCEFCEAIIKDVRAFVDDKNNQEEVKTFLTDACNIIPDEQLAQLCKTTVTEEFDELIKMIDSELDPSVVCSAMGLCTGFKKLQHKSKVDTNVCEFCEAIIKDIRDFVDDKNNQQQVKDMLSTVCKLIPDQEVVDLCITAVNEEIDMLIQMIDADLDPAEVCKEIQACTATMKKAVQTPDKELCADCINFFMEIKSKMADENIENQLQLLIDEEICPHTVYTHVCTFAVDQYLPQILKMVSTELNPQAICSEVTLCAKTPEVGTVLVKLVLQGLSAHGAVVPAGKATSDEECQLCKAMLTDTQKFYRSEDVQKTIEDFVKNKFCPFLEKYEGLCKQGVDFFGPDEFNLLAKELDPDKWCPLGGFCPADTIEGVVRASVPKSPLPKVSGKTPAAKETDPSTQCVLCEFVIQTLDKELGDNATEEEIIKALDEVCEALPDTLKETCETFVKQYGPTVIALLLQELDPQQVCTKLGLCTGLGVSASTECILCQFVMKEVDQLLSNNNTEAEIIAALDKVCNLMPSSITTDCLDFVNTYGPAVIALLEQELEPSVICAVIGLCPQKKAKLMLKAPIGDSDNELCGVCQTVIQYMDSLIQENATIQEIEQVIEKICNFLPDTMKQQCDDLVAQYGPAIIQLIAQFLDPREICTSIGLCSNASKESNGVEMEKIVPAKVPLLGENDCTMGPAFWCLNMENALKCNTVDHCKRNVWN